TAQIADAAEVSSSTFFKYFPTKADVVFGLLEALLESVDKRLTDCRKGESAAEALVDWIETDLPEVEGRYVELFQESDRLIASAPGLQAQPRLRGARFEDVLAAAFARDLGEPADALRPRVLAAIAWRGMVDVWNAWRETHASAGEEDIAEICAVKADYVRRAL